MITLQEARERIARIPPIAAQERVPVDIAFGRILSEDLVAGIPSPPFDNSAMDGFCFSYSSLKNEPTNDVELRVIADIFAGDSEAAKFSEAAAQGQRSAIAARIMTGAPLPAWADTVVPVERTLFDEISGCVRLTNVPDWGANIRRTGEDIPRGATLLKAGSMVGPEHQMILTNFGISEVSVRTRPEMVLFATGDELAESGTTLQPGQIFNSSRVFLSSSIRLLGLPLLHSEHLHDDTEHAAKRIAAWLPAAPRKGAGLPETPRMIITTGAVSAGDADFIPQVAASLGFETVFHRLAIRPGKPVFLAVKGSCVWLGLPGNPISTTVGWHFVAREILRHWAGIPGLRQLRLPLAASVRKPKGLRCLFRGSLENGSVRVLPGQGSAHFLASTIANTYIELPEDPENLEEGCVVVAHLPPGLEQAAPR